MKRFKLSAPYWIQRNVSGLVTYSCLFRFARCKTVYIEQKTSTLFGKASWTLFDSKYIHDSSASCHVSISGSYNVWCCYETSDRKPRAQFQLRRRDPQLISFLFRLKFADVAFYPGKTISESQTSPLWTTWIWTISHTTDTLNYAKNIPLILNHLTRLSPVTLTFHEKN